jgi:peptide/nickel transport system ATP-binding protein
MAELLLDADLRVEYPKRGEVLRDFRLQIRPGEIFGLAGQSGCGKSTFALATLRLLDPVRAKVCGSLRFSGVDLLKLRERDMREIRGKEIGLILQSPLAALNPRLKIGAQLAEAWYAHRSRAEPWKDRVRMVLGEVSLPSDDAFLRRYPKELSVGMAQRLLIAMAVLHRPKLIIADEATSALDLITQAEILELFRRENRSHETSILFITHDLAAAASLCDRVGIVYEGRIAECGPTRQIFERPEHPYTRRLISALPRFEAPDSTGLLSLGRELAALQTSHYAERGSDPGVTTRQGCSNHH